MRNMIIIAAMLATSATAGGLWYASSGGSLAAAAVVAVPPAPVPVIAAKVARSDVPIYLKGIGTVVADNTDVVRSQIQGQLTEISFTEGQFVKAGELLAQIDPRPYQAEIAQLSANRDRDTAQLSNALANLKRDTQLGDKGFATAQLIENQQAQVTQLQATVKADQALIDQASIQLGYTRLTSAIPGITGLRQIDVGNIIHPADPNGLVVVTQIEPISVTFALPETDLPQIQDQMAQGPLKVIAYSQDGKTRLDEGKLLVVNNQIVQGTGTVELKAEFPNAQHRLWPGQLITVNLLLTTRKNGLTVAGSAVQQGPSGSYVYVVTPSGTAQLRPVTVAQISQGQALVDSGLSGDETVVVDGQYRLKDGSMVQPLHGKAAREAELQSAVQDALP
ncbi:efflux RND transporter periplasmic adaptor subunit [Bradyrhizobium sp. HKCCYLR20261]|uniref:efflux RND transporter periplasmic adaptor subunit n=1 Tax=Bradyrhizobium sp. HKCCYLR20261 TaxID=3420760 RepID=UPI003EB98B3B